MSDRSHNMLGFASVFAIGALCASGCSPTVHWPNLFHPGPAGYQRAVAEKYDPYPSPDAGPEIVGGRPLGYQRPLNDVEWSRRFGSPNRVGAPVPLPPITTAPAPIYGAPPLAPAPVVAPSPLPFQQNQRRY